MTDGESDPEGDSQHSGSEGGTGTTAPTAPTPPSEIESSERGVEPDGDKAGADVAGGDNENSERPTEPGSAPSENEVEPSDLTEPTLTPPSIENEDGEAGVEPDDPNLTPPEAPDSLPAYVAEPLKRQPTSKLQDVIEFAERLIEFNSQPIPDETVEQLENDDSVGDVDKSDVKGVIVTRKVTCGTDTCQCMTKDEDKMHGPYKYRYYRNDRGEVVTDYMGPA